MPAAPAPPYNRVFGLPLEIVAGDAAERQRRMVEILDRDPGAQGLYDEAGALLGVFTSTSAVESSNRGLLTPEEHLARSGAAFCNGGEIRYLDEPFAEEVSDNQLISSGQPSQAFTAFRESLWRDATWRAPLASGERITTKQSDREAGGRTLSLRERLFMLRSPSRLESELSWLINNNATVCHAWKEAQRANLSETTAAEMALICLARENEDLHARIRRLEAALATPP